MKIVIYGAGAIGGVVGAAMTAGGEAVTLVDIVPEHVQAMNESGLHIRSATGEQQIPVRAGLAGDLSGVYDIVFLAVKSQHTEAALDGIVPLLGPDSIVVSLQNGLNEPRIAARVGSQRTIGAMVDFSADYHGPALIMRGRNGALHVGELNGEMTSRLEQVRRLLDRAMPCASTANVMGYVWSKICKGSMDATTSLADADMAEVRGNRQAQPALAAIIREGALVAAAEGVTLEPYEQFDPFVFLDPSPAGMVAARRVLDEMAEEATHDLKVRTGYWRDIVVRKRPSEIAYISGEIVEHGRLHGIPTPANLRQLELFAEIESGRRPFSWQNVDEIRKAAGV